MMFEPGAPDGKSMAYGIDMPHFEWLGIARTGPPTSSVWMRVLLGVVLGWVFVGIGVAIVLLTR